ncbi:MAG TPA: type III secretion system outer membrane ring subunit SctC [Geminicoccaceae bacterium]|nr:type III secretion system outer membrane ring subunit SctC [Geminicoccaceae bacterium]
MAAGAPARRLLTALLAWAALAFATAAVAATPNWPREPYTYVTVDQDLTQVLKEFAANLGLTIQISPNVGGMVRGRLPSVPPVEFLEILARTYGLIWYYDGIILYVYGLDEVQSRIIKLDSASLAALSAALVELDIDDPRFPWTVSEASGILYVAGPPRYVELVAETAAMLGTTQQVRIDIRVFPLRHALADDRTFSVRNQEVVVPGVATILARLVGAEGGGGTIGTQRNRFGGTTLTTLPGVARAGPYAGFAAADARLAARAEEETLVTAATGLTRDTDLDVRIQADPRLNAVIVKDFLERMPLYEQLIRSLDQPQKLVELEVVIADINSSRLEELGVDWRLGFDQGSTNVDVGVGNPLAPAVRSGLTFATAITGDPFSFLARIRALEETGDARVLSRPTVLTFDNVEALFDQSESFFVRLEGNEAVDLVEVQVGLLVKVTPHLIEDSQRTRVQMIIDIEDGTTSPQQVDDLPTILRATLSTQGIVNQQQALVIGGFYRERQLDNLAKVPWLGDIPILGWTLFRQKRQEQTSIVRLFMIRPMVIEDQPERPVVSSTLRLDGPPRPLFPPAANLRYTPSGRIVLDSVRFGTLLQDQINARGYEALCLARAAMGDVCRPAARPAFALEAFQSFDERPPSDLPPAPGRAAPAHDPRAPRPLY